MNGPTGSAMTVYIGIDFHPYEKSVAYADDRDGEIGYRRFLHSDKQSLRAFYRKMRRGAVIGTGARGSLCRSLSNQTGTPQKTPEYDAETVVSLTSRGTS